jgi:hypothetical protein
VSIVACKSQELLDLSHAAGSRLGLHFVDLGLFHFYHAFRHLNTQEVEMVLLEGALFWVEVKVILAEPGEDLPDQEVVAGNVFILCFSLFSPCVDRYVIHVDRDIHSIDEVSEYGVHHGLEVSRGVG